MTARDLLARHMTEDELLANVLDLSATLRLPAHHCRPARTVKGWRTPIQGRRGFVDLVIAGAGGVLFPELKDEISYPDRDQRAWRDVLLASGQRYRLWRPRHWLSGEIRAELEALAKGEVRV